MNTQIKGHLQVTRTLTVAGRALSQGNMDVSGNLHVGGWLDARNIKAPCKGLFATAAALNASYPAPKPGWWALVGATLPAAIYRSDGEGWADTGETGGDISVDLNAYDDAIERIDGRIADISDDVARIDADIANISHPVAVSDAQAAADLDIADEAGNVLVRFAGGHVRTRLFDSANIQVQLDTVQSDVVLTDSATGVKYRLGVKDGAMQLVPIDGAVATAVSNILVLGNSFTRHDVRASYGWNCVRGMAATVDSNDYVSLLAEGTSAHVEIAHTPSSVNCAHFEQNYSPNYSFASYLEFDRSLSYDLVIVELCENASYGSTMTESWRALYSWLKTVCPQAKLLQLIGWDQAQRTAAIQAACTAEGVTMFNNVDLTYVEPLVGGQYITDSTNVSANTITSTIVSHPSDVGMLLAANRILQWLGLPQLQYKHDIAFECVGAGVVEAFNGYPSAVYRGLVTISASSVPASIVAVDASGTSIELTHRGDGIYTFFMPDSDVKVTATF